MITLDDYLLLSVALLSLLCLLLLSHEVAMRGEVKAVTMPQNLDNGNTCQVTFAILVILVVRHKTQILRCYFQK